MDTWYGTMLIPEYGITILNTYDYGAFHGYFIYGDYTCFMFGLCCLQFRL